MAGEGSDLRLWFLIRSLEAGGAERQLVTLARGLKERKGWEVGVITFYSGGALEKELREAGVPVWSTEKRGRWDGLRFFRRLVSFIRQARPHVLHGYLPMSNLLALGLRRFIPGMKVVWGVRASFMDLSPYDGLARWEYRLNRVLARYADLIVVNSWAGREECLRQGYPAAKMVVIPNGIDTSRFSPDPEGRRRVRREWGVEEEEKLVGLVARLDPMKDHSTFLQAAAILSPRGKEVKFVCIGDGPPDYRYRLQDQARGLGIGERVIWAGKRGDMPAVYSACDLVTSSSSFGEGFSNALAEAMACGVPCVATEVGDSALILGSLGAVVPPRDPRALAEAWEKMLFISVEERERISRECRRRIEEEFGVEALVERTTRAIGGLWFCAGSNVRDSRSLA